MTDAASAGASDPRSGGDPEGRGRPEADGGARAGGGPDAGSRDDGISRVARESQPALSDAAKVSRSPGVLRRATGTAVGVAGGAVRSTVSGTKAFWCGTRCVVKGAGRLVASPHLWPYGIAPVVIGIFVFVGTTFWLFDWLVTIARAWSESVLGEAGGVVAVILTFTVVVGAALVAMYVAFPAIVRVIAAPFLALLSDRVYQDVTGMAAPTPPGSRFVRWVLRPIGEALVLLVIRMFVTVVALPLICIPVVGAPLFFCVLLPLEGMDLLDLAQSARALPLGQRLRFVRKQVAASAGLGLGAAGVLFVPILNVFFLPALVIGAVLLDREISADFPTAPSEPPDSTLADALSQADAPSQEALDGDQAAVAEPRS